MQYALEVRPADGEAFYVGLPEAGAATLGREAGAGLVLEDRFLSRVHFQLEMGNGRTVLTDLGSSNGTFVNGVRLLQTELRHGDSVRAGQHTFRLTAVLEGRPALKAMAQMPVELTPAQEELAAGLTRGCKFAVVDGAADPAVGELLKMSGLVYQSLYEGEQAAEVAPFGPFLVALRNGEWLARQIVKGGWGNGWGIFLRTKSSFEEVRKHLRRSLTVQAEDGRQMLFRFYDPRVLRLFLPTCEATQRAEFFGPIDHFVVELAEGGRLEVFSRKTAEEQRGLPAVGPD